MKTIPLLAAALCIAAVAAATADEIQFARDIAPLLQARCVTCHHAKKAEGGYRLDSFAQLLKAGDSEADPIVESKPNDSELFRRIASDDEFERMPAESDPLPANEMELIRRWIEQGARCNDQFRDKPLAAIIPALEHPPAPQTYRVPIPITAVEFSADGSRLFVSGYHEVTVWNVSEGLLMDRIGNVGRTVHDLDLHRDGNKLAIACGQAGKAGEVRIVDLASKSVLYSLARSGDVCFATRFSPDGELLAVGSSEATVRIFSVADAVERVSMTSHSDWVTAIAWSDNGDRLATASRDKTAKVFDIESGNSLITFDDHKAEVRGVAFQADGERVYSVGGDRKLRQWKISDGKQEKDTSLEGDPFGLVTGTDHLFVPSSSGCLIQLARSNGNVEQQRGDHSDWFVSAAAHEKSRRIAAGGIDGRVIVWDAESGKEVASFLAVPQ